MSFPREVVIDEHRNRKALETRRSLFDRIVSGMKKRGLIPSSYGVTRKVDYDNPVGELDKMMLERRVTHGGAALDLQGNSTSQSYGQRRYDFIKAEEGLRKYTYDDATGQTVKPSRGVIGNPTVGVGFNLNRPDAPKVMKEVLGITGKDYQMILEGRKALDESQVRTLFDYTIQEAEDIVNSKLGDVGLREHQRLALVSLAFNGGPSLIGPKITEAIRSGDWESARKEILHNSGSQSNKRLQGRRNREAAIFMGTANTYT